MTIRFEIIRFHGSFSSGQAVHVKRYLMIRIKCFLSLFSPTLLYLMFNAWPFPDASVLAGDHLDEFHLVNSFTILSERFVSLHHTNCHLSMLPLVIQTKTVSNPLDRNAEKESLPTHRKMDMPADHSSYLVVSHGKNPFWKSIFNSSRCMNALDIFVQPRSDFSSALLNAKADKHRSHSVKNLQNMYDTVFLLENWDNYIERKIVEFENTILRFKQVHTLLL